MTEDSTYPEETVNHTLQNRLGRLAIKLKDFGKENTKHKGKNQKKVKANE